MWWTCGSGTIELDITKAIARRCSHSGPCDFDIMECLKIPYIKRQFKKYTNEQLASELRSYGAWDEEDLKDYQGNKERILWIACNDIVEEQL